MRKAKLVEKSFNVLGFIFTAFSLLFFAVSYLRFDPPVITGIVSMAGFGLAYFFFTVGSLIANTVLLREKNKRKRIHALKRARIRARKRIYNLQNDIPVFAANTAKGRST